MSRVLTPEEIRRQEEADAAALRVQADANDPNPWTNFGDAGGNFIFQILGAIFQPIMEWLDNMGIDVGDLNLGQVSNAMRRGDVTAGNVSVLQSTADGGGFAPLFGVIQSAESARGDIYNGFNNARGGNNLINNVPGTKITDLTFDEFIAEQDRRHDAGYNTAGAWPQLIRSTAKEMREADPSLGSRKMTPEFQDELAMRRLETMRDFDGFMNGSFTGVENPDGDRITVTLAANPTQEQIEQYYRDYITYNIAAEWAGIPRADTGRSFYDGISGNESNVDIGTVTQALNDTVANIPGYRLYAEAERAGLITPPTTLDADGDTIRTEFVERDIRNSDEYAQSYLDRYSRGLGADSSATEVRLAQLALSELGQDIDVDGVWGPQTNGALDSYIQGRDSAISTDYFSFYEGNISNDPDPSTDETPRDRAKTIFNYTVAQGRPTDFTNTGRLESLATSFGVAAEGITVDGVMTNQEWIIIEGLSQTFTQANTAEVDITEAPALSQVAATQADILEPAGLPSTDEPRNSGPAELRPR